MKKICLALTVFFAMCFANQVQAQDYQSAIGLRLGYPISASYKFFITDPGAIEVYAGFRGYSGYGYFNIGGMYQHHMPISGVDGLNWYVGGGLSALFFNYKSSFIGLEGESFGLGINGALGLDYKFADIPLNLSVDWLPTVYVSGYLSGFGGGLGALSVRYTLN